MIRVKDYKINDIERKQYGYAYEYNPCAGIKSHLKSINKTSIYLAASTFYPGLYELLFLTPFHIDLIGAWHMLFLFPSRRYFLKHI